MNKTSPLKAIRKFCLECAGTSKDVAACSAHIEAIVALDAEERDGYVECPLYPYRLGHRPGYPGNRVRKGENVDKS